MCSWHWRRFEIPHSSSCKILFVLGVVWGFLVDTVILLSCYQPCKVWFSYRGAERVTAPNGLFAVSELWINALIPSPQFLASSMFCQCRLQEDPTFLQHLIYQVVDQVPSKFWLKGRIGWWPWIALTLCWVSLASLKQWNLSDLFFSASLNQELFIWIYICWHIIKHFPQTLNPIYLEQCSVHENSCKFFSLPCCPAPCMYLEASTASSWVTSWSSHLRDVRLLTTRRPACGQVLVSGVCGLPALLAASPGKMQQWSSSKRSLRTVLPSQVCATFFLFPFLKGVQALFLFPNSVLY